MKLEENELIEIVKEAVNANFWIMPKQGSPFSCNTSGRKVEDNDSSAYTLLAGLLNEYNVPQPKIGRIIGKDPAAMMVILEQYKEYCYALKKPIEQQKRKERRFGMKHALVLNYIKIKIIQRKIK